MFWKNVLKVIESILVGALVLVAAVLAVPFVILAMLISMPVDAIIDIWSE